MRSSKNKNREEDQNDEDSDNDGGSDDSFQALVNNYRKRPETPKKSSPVKKQAIPQRLTNMSCILCDKEIDKSVSLSCKGGKYYKQQLILDFIFR